VGVWYLLNGSVTRKESGGKGGTFGNHVYETVDWPKNVIPGQEREQRVVKRRKRRKLTHI